MEQIKLIQKSEGTYQCEIGDILPMFIKCKNIALEKSQVEMLTLSLSKMIQGELAYDQIKPTNTILNLLGYEVIIK